MSTDTPQVVCLHEFDFQDYLKAADQPKRDQTLPEMPTSFGSPARHADGAPLVLTPHDCRRVFASEHLNAHTPVQVIQALLGHATIDTVMIYAKLYPDQFITDYRKAMRGLYTDVYGADANQAPTNAEWAEFTANCSMRDMGTHVCALPTGEHCPRGLVCLGCGHAQPKKSALPSSAGC